MINDRGKIKWSSLMLPEHVAMLQSFYSKDTQKKKPILSEEYINDMEQILHQAIHHKQKVKISYYNNGSFAQVIGAVHQLQPLEGKIVIEQANTKRQIPFSDIIAIDLPND